MRPEDTQYSLKEDIHKIMDNDTPSAVKVPDNIFGFGSWLIARCGMGVIAIYACWIIYNDLKDSNQRILIAFEKSIQTQTEFRLAVEGNNRSQAEMRSILESHIRVLERLDKRLEALERR